jgi:hypothetical protein
MLIGSPQLRHFPRRISQLMTGMLSRGAISLPQPGQRERGCTTDSPAGTRWITTFKNEPMSSPIRPTNPTSNQVTREL